MNFFAVTNVLNETGRYSLWADDEDTDDDGCGQCEDFFYGGVCDAFSSHPSLMYLFMQGRCTITITSV